MNSSSTQPTRSTDPAGEEPWSQHTPRGQQPSRDEGRALAVVATEVCRTYGTGDTAVTALDGVNLSIEAGTFVALMGPSGSGKSTLIHCLAGLDLPDKNPNTRIVVGGQDIIGLSDDQLTRFRRRHVGFVFQSFNLVPTLTGRQNIELPLTLAGQTVDAQRIDSLADSLDIRSRLDHRPDEMSGGQQQRVAIARAMLPQPSVIIADEPTGALDSATSHEVMRLLRRSVDEFHQTVVIVTHEPQVADAADRVIRVRDGRVEAQPVSGGVQ